MIAFFAVLYAGAIAVPLVPPRRHGAAESLTALVANAAPAAAMTSRNLCAGVLAGVKRSSGVVLWPTGILIAAIWLVEIPTAYWLSRSIGLDGVWIGYPAAFVAAFLAQFAYYALIWRRRRHRPLVERSSC